MDNKILIVLVDSMKSCAVQRDLIHASTTAGILLLLYAFTSSAYGQSSSPYANCISLFMAGDVVQLTEDEDCNSSQWQEAVQYYKANGYPHEESYMDMLGSKFIQLDSDKWVQDQADLDAYLKENK
jgi:hypothetical protein